ncbi:hypothetical protein VWM78_09780, partial [Campylobacter coli]
QAKLDGVQIHRKISEFEFKTLKESGVFVWQVLSVGDRLELEELAFLTDTAGLYENFEDKNSLISKISITQAKALVDKIQGGMHV